MRITASVLLLSLGTLASITPALAKDGQKKARDPNETVCENEEVLGSRLAVRRVCMTRAQWAEKQRDDRAITNRSQTQLCVAQNGACTAGD